MHIVRYNTVRNDGRNFQWRQRKPSLTLSHSKAHNRAHHQATLQHSILTVSRHLTPELLQPLKRMFPILMVITIKKKEISIHEPMLCFLISPAAFSKRSIITRTFFLLYFLCWSMFANDFSLLLCCFLFTAKWIRFRAFGWFDTGLINRSRWCISNG